MTLLILAALADEGRWLEHPRRPKVVDWWTERDADTRAWLEEDGRVEAITAWLEGYRWPEHPSLRDHVAGTSIWTTWLEDEDDGWTSRLTIQRGGPWPGEAFEHDLATGMSCAATLSPDGTLLLSGWVPKDDHAACNLLLTDLDAGTTRQLFRAARGGVSWSPDSDGLLVRRRRGRRMALTWLPLDGPPEDLFLSRRSTRAFFTPTGQIAGQSSWTVGGGERKLRLLYGPRDDLAWLGNALWTPWFGEGDIVGATEDALLLLSDAHDGTSLQLVDPEDPWYAEHVPRTELRPGMELKGARKHGDTLLTVWSRDGFQQLEETPWEGGPSNVIALGQPATRVRVWRSLSQTAIISASSPTSVSWFLRDTEGFIEPVEGSWSDPSYETLSLEADGVPLTWVGPRQHGTLPVWMTVYGGFGLSSQMGSLDPGSQYWLAAGGAVVLVHARGGQERGEAWHTDAIRTEMDKTFDDVVTAATWLREQGLASSVAVSGGSNGGLTVAASVASQPDAFDAGIGTAGVYDLIRGPRFGRWWPEEYGRHRKPDERAVLHAQSPVHRDIDGELPPMLIVTGARDDIVDPAHSYKLVDAWSRLPGGPVKLLVDLRGSHGGASIAPDDHNAPFGTLPYMLAFLCRTMGIQDIPQHAEEGPLEPG
jgi:prolyl oligopeptidase